jgi:ABC-2 type transport system permease protein
MVAENLSFARALVATNFRATIALRGAFVMQVVFMALNNFAFFIFWWALMQHVTTLRGWQLGDIQLLFGVVASAFGLTVAFAGGVRHLGRFIEDGDLDTLLTQPKSVLVHALGMRSQPSGFGDFISGLIFIVWSGQITWHTAPWVVVVVATSAVMFVACGIAIFSLAFWLGRIDTAATGLWELLVSFSLYPEPLFGGTLRVVLFTVLPAGFVGYLPVRILHGPTLANVATLVAVAVGYLCLAVVMFDRGLRRYASGSRFTTFG